MTNREDMIAAGVAEERLPEYEAIIVLLMQFAVTADASSITRRVASACLKDGHLWQAMGLADRAGLRLLMEEHFPGFASQNDRDMRWKRFIYRRLCGWPGFSG